MEREGRARENLRELKCKDVYLLQGHEQLNRGPCSTLQNMFNHNAPSYLGIRIQTLNAPNLLRKS